MANITMCINEFCPLKKDCERYTAIPNEFYQAYGDFDYYYDSKGNVVCKDYKKPEHKSNRYEKL
jgi:hypothetical protein